MDQTAGIQQFTFRRVNNGVLAIQCHALPVDEVSKTDGQPLRSLSLTATSTDASSPWNFALTPANAAYYVRVLGLDPWRQSRRFLASDVPDGWMDNEYPADESAEDGGWEVPVAHDSAEQTRRLASSRRYWNGKWKTWTEPEAVWCRGFQHNFFRFDLDRLSLRPDRSLSLIWLKKSDNVGLGVLFDGSRRRKKWT